MAGKAFVRAYTEPAHEETREVFSQRQAGYNTLWQYYNNKAFEDIAKWARYKADNRLYRAHRNIYNPTKRLVNFYAGKVYPGYVTAFPEDDSQVLAYPLSANTSAQLKDALQQLWQWTNWQTGKSVLVRNTAAVGDRLVEIVDNPARGKVYFEQVWPGHVKEMRLNEVGDVQDYTLEYIAHDKQGLPYEYRKVVTKTSITHYKDGRAYEVEPLEYGFIPACWFRHLDEGSTWGAPALRSIGKVDELNGLVSQAHDNLRKQMGAPLIISTEDNLRRLGEKSSGKRDADTEDSRSTGSAQNEAEILNIWTTKKPASIATITLDPAASLEWVLRMIKEVEADHPECTFYEQLREMQQVSGVAVSQLMGDVDGYLVDAQSTYDQQCVKLFQMAIAIAGWRTQNGDWQADEESELSEQQKKFAPFNLDSYGRGDLDFSIKPRPLFALSPLELLDLERKRLEVERLKTTIAYEKANAAMAQNPPAAVESRLRQAAERSA